MKSTKNDMLRARSLHPYTTANDIPVSYRIGDTVYHGFPAAFAPAAVRKRIDANIYETTVTARTPEGLTLRAECTEYTDYPVVEWVMFIRNDGAENSPTVSDWRIDPVFDGVSPRLQHGNGSCDRASARGLSQPAHNRHRTRCQARKSCGMQTSFGTCNTCYGERKPLCRSSAHQFTRWLRIYRRSLPRTCLYDRK